MAIKAVMILFYWFGLPTVLLSILDHFIGFLIAIDPEPVKEIVWLILGAVSTLMGMFFMAIERWDRIQERRRRRKIENEKNQ